MLLSKIKNNKRGITLIELIVAMALTVIILTASTAFITPLYSYYGQSVNKAKGIRVSNAIEKRLKEFVPNALNAYVTLSTAALTGTENKTYYLYVASGKIVLSHGNGVSSISDIFITDAEYEGFLLSLIIKTKYKNLETTKYTILQFNLTLTKGTTTVTRTVTINLPNMDFDLARKIRVLETSNDPAETGASSDYKSLKLVVV